MNVIKNNNSRVDGIRCSCGQSQAWISDGDVGKSAVQFLGVCRFVLSVMLCTLFLFCQDFFRPAPVFGAANFEIFPVTELTKNADGHTVGFPTALFYDRSVDETYVIADNLVTIYASTDFFPLATFGRGRGITSPVGGFVDTDKGMIYICQSSVKGKPGRISVYNGAFMLVREFNLDGIPGASDFQPTHVVVSHDGLIYVAGRNERGVVVLDSDGEFLRWLKPMDKVYLSAKGKALLRSQGVPMKSAEATENGESPDSSAEEPAQENAASTSEEQPTEKKNEVDIPAQFRPKTEKEKEAEGGFYILPVPVCAITKDRAGRLYVLSDATSKTYVYSPQESFLFSFGTKGGGPRMLSTPRGVAIDDDRHLVYVVDYMRDAILTYSQQDGQLLFEFGGKGGGPGWFNFPNDIITNKKGQVIVSDLFNHRVQVLKVKYLAGSSLVEEQKKAPSSSGTGDEDKGGNGK